MLTRELLKKIRKIEIVTERLVRDRMAGQYHSVFKGSGIAFSEVRQYMPGDDIRLIDWNVSARMNDTVRQALHRRARDDRAAAGRHVGVGALRLARAGEARAGRRDRGGAGVLGHPQQRPRRPHHLHRRRREVRAAQEGQEARPARHQRDPVLPAEEPAHQPRARARVPGAHRAAARGGLPDLGLSRAAGQLRARAAHHGAAPRPGARCRSPIRWRRRCPTWGSSSSRTPRPARSSCSTPAGPEGRAFAREARRGSRRARRCSGGSTWTRCACAPTSPYLPALTSFFEARARRLRH